MKNAIKKNVHDVRRLQALRGMGVPPMKPGQDGRATLGNHCFRKCLDRFVLGSHRVTGGRFLYAIGLLAMGLGLLGLPSTAGAYGEPYGVSMNTVVLYVGNEEADMNVAIKGFGGNDIEYTVAVTLSRNGAEVAQWMYFGVGEELNQTFTHYEKGLNPGQTYTYTAKADIYWYDPYDDEFKDYTVSTGDTEITAGEIKGTIGRDIVWAGGTWSLDEIIHVTNNATLTIKSVRLTRIIGDYMSEKGTFVVRFGNIVMDDVTFSEGHWFSIINTSGIRYSEPDETYASSSVIVKNSTINAERLDIVAQNAPVFKGNSGDGNADLVFKPFRVSDLPVITGNYLTNCNLEILSRMPVNITIRDNTLNDVTLSGGTDLLVKDNHLHGWLRVREGYSQLNDGSIVISNNTFAGRVEVRGLGSSDLDIDSNRFEYTRDASIGLGSFYNEPSPGTRSITRNIGLRGIALGGIYMGGEVSHVNVENNDILDFVGFTHLSRTDGFGIIIGNGSHNVIRGNTITDVGDGAMGIRLGVLEDLETQVASNLIADNTIIGWDYGIGLGSAQENIIRGNTLKSNHIANIHIPGTDRPFDAIGYPTGNRIYDNRFELPTADNPKQVIVKSPRPGHLNYWNDDPAPGMNIVGGPYLGGNYWSDYDGVDADRDGFGDTPYVIDPDRIDALPLVLPVVLIDEGPGNPVGRRVLVSTPEEPLTERDIDVMSMLVTISDRADGPVRLDSLLINFFSADASRVQGADVETVYLLAQDPDNYEAPPIKIAEGVGFDVMMFLEEDFLGEALDPGQRRLYTLQYVIKQEYPVGVEYGARTDPGLVSAVYAESGESVLVGGSAVNGSVFRPGSTLTAYVFPEGAGTVTVTPDQPYYALNDAISLTAQAGEGYEFRRFYGLPQPLGDSVTDPYVSFPVVWPEGQDWEVGVVFINTNVPPPSNGKLHGTVGDPVNTATGEFYFERPLFDLGGVLPLGCGLYYGNTVARRIDGADIDQAFGQALGPNWLHNFQLLRLYKGDRETHIIYDRGKILSFMQRGNEWQRMGDDEVAYVLKADAEGHYYLFDPDKERVYVFDPGRRLERVEDLNGNRHLLGYDSNGNLTTVSDGLGRTLNYTYDGNRLTGVNDGQGRAYTFGYTDNLLTTITDPLGHTTTYAYDPDGNGLVTGVTDPGGHTQYTQVYDDQGRVTVQTDYFGRTNRLSFREDGIAVVDEPDGGSVEQGHVRQKALNHYQDAAGLTAAVDYNENLDITALHDRRGETTQIAYDADTGLREAITNPDGVTVRYRWIAIDLTIVPGVSFVLNRRDRIDYPDGTWEGFSYDDRGNLTSYRDPANGIWSMTYNSRGQMVKLTNPAGGENRYMYHDDGTLAGTESSDTGPVSYEYDDLRRPVAAIFPDGSRTSVTLDALDRILSSTDQATNATTYAYDLNGNLTRVTDAAGRDHYFGYDPMNRLIAETNRLGAISRYGYDEMGRLAQTELPDGSTVSYGYDAAGRFAWMEDQAGHRWSNTYDGEGVLISQSTPLEQRTTYQADGAGHISGFTIPGGGQAQMERDQTGKLVSAVAGDNPMVTFGYDPRGLVNRIQIDGRGAITAQYDNLGNMTQLTDVSGNIWQYGYNTMGRRISLTDPLGRRWDYTFDAMERLTALAAPDGNLITRTYDSRGNLIAVHSSKDDRTDEYAFDVLNRMVSAGDLTLTYDDDDRITAATEGGHTFQAEYNVRGMPVMLDYVGLFQVHYEYDARGTPIRVSDTLTGTWVELTDDADGRLVTIERSNDVDTRFEWDANDRLQSIVHGTLADLRLSYDARGLISGIDQNLPLDAGDWLSAAGPVWTPFAHDAAGQVSTEAFGYDAVGQRVSDDRGRHFNWDGSGNLVGMTTDDTEVDMDYNAMGKLVARRQSGDAVDFYYHYSLADMPLVGEKGSNGWVRFYVWVPGGNLLYMIDAVSNTVSFYHADQGGSTVFLTDDAGDITDTYAYSPFGLLLAHEGNNSQPFTYDGTYGVRREADDGLYQMGARYYDAHSAAFLSKEPLGMHMFNPETMNPYLYPRNPLQYGDPDGAWAWGKGVRNIVRAIAGTRAGKNTAKSTANAANNSRKSGSDQRSLAGGYTVIGPTHAVHKPHKPEENQRSFTDKAATFVSDVGLGFIPGSAEGLDLISKDIDDVTVLDYTDYVGGTLRDIIASPITFIKITPELIVDFDLLSSEGVKPGLKKVALDGGRIALEGTVDVLEAIEKGYGESPTRVYNMLADPAANSSQVYKDQTSGNFITRWSSRAGSAVGGWLF